MRMTKWVGYYTPDPMDIETRFSTDDAFIWPSSGMTVESRRRLDRVKVIIESLPPREADFIQAPKADGYCNYFWSITTHCLL